jgi:hypothetical protein
VESADRMHDRSEVTTTHTQCEIEGDRGGINNDCTAASRYSADIFMKLVAFL